MIRGSPDEVRNTILNHIGFLFLVKRVYKCYYQKWIKPENIEIHFHCLMISKKIKKKPLRSKELKI